MDVNGDGFADLLTGSNCCDCFELFWTQGAGDDLFSVRHKVEMSFGDRPRPQIFKCWPIPRMVDYNRDGYLDVIVVYRKDIDSDYACISYGGESLNRTDGVWEFEPLELNLPSTSTYSPRVFDFGDFDGDGNFDLVASTEQRSDDTMVTSRIVFMKNMTDSGMPKFESPVELYRAETGWRVDSIDVGGIDNQPFELIASTSLRNRNDYVSKIFTLIDEQKSR